MLVSIIMVVFGIAENRYLLVQVNREMNSININQHPRKGYDQMDIFERTNGIDDWISNGKTADNISDATMQHFRANQRKLVNNKDILWSKEVSGKWCPNSEQMRTQVACQSLCESRSNCIGISYSHTTKNPTCFLCKDDKMEDSGDGFGFYRRSNFGCRDHETMCMWVEKEDCCSVLLQNKCPKACNKCKVDGGWGTWEPYGECSVKCGSGIVVRTRKCDRPPKANGGKECYGSDRQKKTCYKEDCTGITTIDCNEPYDTEVTNSGSIIQSPNYPKPYAPNQDCRITIRFSSRIRSKFSEFDVEQHHSCLYDYMIVYDGPDAGSKKIKNKFCGNNIPTEMISSGNTMHIHFHSDNAVQKTGFRFKVVEYGSSVCLKEGKICGGKETCCAGLECRNGGRGRLKNCRKKGSNVCLKEGKICGGKDPCCAGLECRNGGRGRLKNCRKKARGACSNMRSDSDCNGWKNIGYCTSTYVEWMKTNCKKACNYCG